MVRKPRSSSYDDDDDDEVMELMFTKFNAKMLTLVIAIFSGYFLTTLLGW